LSEGGLRIRARPSVVPKEGSRISALAAVPFAHGQACTKLGSSRPAPRRASFGRLTCTMATLITHAVVATALGQAVSPELRKQPLFWVATVFCSMLPDADVIGFRLGIHYGDLWGHRGMTHSLLFAVVVGCAAGALLGKTAKDRWWLAAFLFVVTASHGLLDAMTDGGLGVAFFSPFDPTRYFFPWRPIAVSPIGAGRFLSARGLHVLWTEICWVWGPALAVGMGLRVLGRRKNRALREIEERT